MAESAVQLFYIRKGAFSQMLQYVLPCVSVWHDHVSVLIISLLPFMLGDSGCHWYCGVPALHSDTDIHVQMEVFICEYKYSFFLPRLLAIEDKVFWPERKEWKHLGSKKKSLKLLLPGQPLLNSCQDTRQDSAQGWMCPGSHLQSVNTDCDGTYPQGWARKTRLISIFLMAPSLVTNHPTCIVLLPSLNKALSDQQRKYLLRTLPCLTIQEPI